MPSHISVPCFVSKMLQNRVYCIFLLLEMFLSMSVNIKPLNLKLYSAVKTVVSLLHTALKHLWVNMLLSDVCSFTSYSLDSTLEPL